MLPAGTTPKRLACFTSSVLAQGAVETQRGLEVTLTLFALGQGRNDGYGNSGPRT